MTPTKTPMSKYLRKPGKSRLVYDRETRTIDLIGMDGQLKAKGFIPVPKEDSNNFLCPLLIITAGIGCFLFWDWVSENLIETILGLFGLGGAAEYQRRANKAKAQAETHQALSQSALDDSMEAMEEAMDSHQQAREAAEDKTDPNYDPPAGFKRKSIRSE